METKTRTQNTITMVYEKWKKEMNERKLMVMDEMFWSMPTSSSGEVR